MYFHRRYRRRNKLYSYKIADISKTTSLIVTKINTPRVFTEISLLQNKNSNRCNFAKEIKFHRHIQTFANEQNHFSLPF
jgi:hypothetical protein